MEGSQGHHGFGMGSVPASSASFDAMGDGLALGFGWAAVNLPMLFLKLGIANDLLALGHILEQPIGGRALGASQGLPPSRQPIVSRVIEPSCLKVCIRSPNSVQMVRPTSGRLKCKRSTSPMVRARRSNE